MSISDAELRHELQHVKLGRRVLGYNRKAVDLLLEGLADNYESLSSELAQLETASNQLRETTLERDELRLRVSELETGSGTSRELDALVRDTLATAERDANALRAQAVREADELRLQARKESTRAIANARIEAHLDTNGGDSRRTRRWDGAHLSLDRAAGRADAVLYANELGSDELGAECRQIRIELQRLEREVAWIEQHALLAAGAAASDQGPAGREGAADPIEAPFRDLGPAHSQAAHPGTHELAAPAARGLGLERRRPLRATTALSSGDGPSG